jgi:hypothetical protein
MRSNSDYLSNEQTHVRLAKAVVIEISKSRSIIRQIQPYLPTYLGHETYLSMPPVQAPELWVRFQDLPVCKLVETSMKIEFIPAVHPFISLTAMIVPSGERRNREGEMPGLSFFTQSPHLRRRSSRHAVYLEESRVNLTRRAWTRRYIYGRQSGRQFPPRRLHDNISHQPKPHLYLGARKQEGSL